MISMIDWDDAFDNSSYIDGASAYFDRWAKAAEEARRTLKPEIDIVYGSHKLETLDLFKPRDEPAGLVIFVHGGYWHLLDKSYFSHLAKGSLESGFAVAIINYPLAPEVSVPKISRSMMRAINHVAKLVSGPIRLIGHSAGGHLVCRAICDDTMVEPDTRARIARVVSVSGVHDLRPLLATSMNETLALTPEQCDRESPALRNKPYNIPTHFWVGAGERPEFLRQNRLAAESWQAAGLSTEETYEGEKHHFSVIDALEANGSALMRALLA